MIKPTKDFKMSKAAKIMLSQISDQHHRGTIKKLVVESEAHEKYARHNKMKIEHSSNNQGEE